jgi:hypothetical protein
MIRTVVHFVDSDTFGGNEQALLHLLAGLDRRRWRSVLLHHVEPGLAPLLEEARRLNVKTRAVPKLGRMQTIAGLPRFFQQLRLECPAIFHAYLNWLLSCKYGLLAAALARVPAIIYLPVVMCSFILRFMKDCLCLSLKRWQPVNL